VRERREIGNGQKKLDRLNATIGKEFLNSKLFLIFWFYVALFGFFFFSIEHGIVSHRLSFIFHGFFVIL